ncbi:hypothetical protein D3C80_1448830 [compost metagenome]
MARRAHQVVVERGRALCPKPVALDSALHDRKVGQVGHHQRQAVLQGDVDAITCGCAQYQWLYRDAGLQLAGDRVQVRLAHVKDRSRVVQRAGLATNDEGFTLLWLKYGDLRNRYGPGIVDQRATTRVKRSTDVLAAPRRITNGQIQGVAQNVIGQRRDYFVVALHGRSRTNAIGVRRGAWAHAAEIRRVTCDDRPGIVRYSEEVGAR